MRTYRTCWTSVAVLAGTVAVVAAVPVTGWGAVVAITVAIGVLGFMFGLAWSADERHWWRPAWQGAAYFALGGVLIIGLPPAIGAWSILALALIGGSTPLAVDHLVRAWRTWRPVEPTEHPQHLSDRDLARRWRSSYDEMGRRDCPATTVLQLVQERSILLDEIERRDPLGFPRWVERVAPRETQDR